MDHSDETYEVMPHEGEGAVGPTNPPALETATMDDDELVTAENFLRAFLAPLENGESFARVNLLQRWYRGFTKIMWTAELEKSALLIVQRGVSSGSDGNAAEGEEEGLDEDGDSDDLVAKVNREFRRKRQVDRILHGEEGKRMEVLQEEQNVISLIVTMMDEVMDRMMLMNNANTMFALIHEVLKPRVQYRYIYAWGVVTAFCFKPLKAEMDRVRPSERHKPAYLRMSQPTCRMPLEPVYYLQDGGKKMAAIEEINRVRAIGWN